MVYGLLGHETFQFSCGWGGDLSDLFYRYTTILNSGLLKVIQFKHGTSLILGSPALRLLRCGHVPARMGARRWHHNSWLVDYEQLKRPTTFSSWWRGGNDPLKWCGLPYVAVKARRLTGWPFWVMTGTGWGEDLNVVYVKFILYRIPFWNLNGKSPIFSMYVVCTFATLQYTLDVSWIP